MLLKEVGAGGGGLQQRTQMPGFSGMEVGDGELEQDGVGSPDSWVPPLISVGNGVWWARQSKEAVVTWMPGFPPSCGREVRAQGVGARSWDAWVLSLLWEENGSW